METPQLTPEARQFMFTVLRRYDSRRRRTAMRLWLGLLSANLSLLVAAAGYVLWWLPSTVSDKVAKRAGQDASNEVGQYIKEEGERFKQQWKLTSDNVAESLKTQVISVIQEFGKAHTKIGEVAAGLRHASADMAEFRRLATDLKGEEGQRLLERIKAVAESVKAQDGIDTILELQGRTASLSGLVASLEERLNQVLRHKAPASEVRFVRVEAEKPTRIQAPCGEQISEWNIVVIPIAIGGKPALVPGMKGGLTDYKAGKNEHGFLDELTCYAQPADDTHWRIYAKQILSASPWGEDPYGLDVCCLMVRKEIVLGNEG